MDMTTTKNSSQETSESLKDKLMIEKEKWKQDYHEKWKDGINARRNDRYHNDDSYRAKVVKESRANRLKRNPDGVVSLKKITLPQVAMRLEQECSVRNVYIGADRTFKFKTFNIRELGKFLGVTYPTVLTYVNTGLIPAPVFSYSTDNNGYLRRNAIRKVYVEDEVKTIGILLAKHYERDFHYTKNDSETTTAIFSHINTYRTNMANSWGVSKEDFL